jgi:hypothetical protein
MALTAQYIEAVITDIDQNGFPNKRRSTGYCLAHEGTHYPPKYVVGRAHAQERNGHEWRADKHYGGESTDCVLRECGFDVIKCTCRNRTQSLN